MNVESRFNPQVISDFFGMINAKNIFSYTNYDFESDCDTSYMKFSDVGDYSHPYNNAYRSFMIFSYASKFIKRKNSIDSISIFKNKINYNRISFIANNLIHDRMGYYGKARDIFTE